MNIYTHYDVYLSFETHFTITHKQYVRLRGVMQNAPETIVEIEGYTFVAKRVYITPSKHINTYEVTDENNVIRLADGRYSKNEPIANYVQYLDMAEIQSVAALSKELTYTNKAPILD